MAQAQISSKFYISLLGFLLNAKQHIIAIGAEHGLTSIQAITLLLLDDRSCPMKALGQMFHCDASNVTGIIDGLEKKGLVARRSDPNDRRIKTIAICPAGRKLQEHIMERMIRDHGYLFDALSPSETEQFITIVEKLNPQKKLA